MAKVPSEKAVRAALARLVAQGVDAVWLPEVQPLLALPAVRDRLAALGEDRSAEALRSVLETAVGELGQSQYRLLLTIVLGLDPEYESLSAREKRRIAGELFRGGEKPVSAGTIRQHHEPKALDELAALLVSPRAAPPAAGRSARSTAAGEPERPALEWHPSVHQRWAGEILVYWRLSFSCYRQPSVVERIRPALRRAGVSSWAVFELFGVFDLLVRAWVPATAVESEVKSSLVEALAVESLELIDSFVVERVLTEWMWVDADGSPRAPSSALLSQELPGRELGHLNRRGGDGQLDRYLSLNVLQRPPRPTPGIGFFVALGLEGSALVLSDAHRSFEQGIVDAAVRSVNEGVTNISIYQGSGFAGFLIQGVVAPQALSDLPRLLLEPLAAATHFARCRLNTFLSSTADPLAHEESIPAIGSPPDDRLAAELLESGEDERLEVRPSAFTELRALARHGSGRSDSPPRSDAVGDRLVEAVAAFLNTDDGAIVIGACEREAIEGRPDLTERPIVSEAPRLGRYLVTGIDHEIGKGRDWYASRLNSLLRSAIEPSPTFFVQTRFETIGERTVCILQVAGQEAGRVGHWFYCKTRSGESKFVVRDGVTTMRLEGRPADEYKTARPRR